MAYNSNNRSERLLQGRRFTTDGISLTQEAFTDVFDLGAGEIYTDDGLIPTGSSQLAFSGSSQDGLIVSASVVNPDITTDYPDDLPILKYWWRHKLKPAGDGNREVYYFTTDEPDSTSDTVNSDQLIESDQQTNFISPKYIISGDSSKNAEANPPGYKVLVYKDTNGSAASISTPDIADDKYVFDYKTGVLTWVDGEQPNSNQYVYMSIYQYVGRTLRSQIDDGSLGGGVDLTDLYDWTSSIDISITSINAFTESVDASITSINSFTESVNISITSINSFTESVDASITSINAFTESVDASITSINAFTESTDTSITAINLFTGSANTSITAINLFTGSANTSITALNTFTGSITGTANEIIVTPDGNGLIIGLPDDVIIQNKLTILGDLVAENYIVSSSTMYMTTSFFDGDTIFGDTMNDTHQFTGSVYVTGSTFFGADHTTTHHMTGSLYVSGALYFDYIDGGTF